MHKIKRIKHRLLSKNKKQLPILGIQPASNGASMQPFIDWINTYSILRPKNIFEIGANLAQDAEYLRNGFGLDARDVWVFEPHPELFSLINNNFNFNSFDLAVLDNNGDVIINAIDLQKNINSGISSARTHNDVPQEEFKKVSVKSIRMDNFLTEHKIDSVDFLKLDVEGCNYEVLDGFGSQINKIKSIHVEAEHYEHWRGEKMWDDIRKILEAHMEMVYFERHFTQSDSFWIKKDYIKNSPEASS